VTHSPLLCSESDKARLENENAVEQLDLSSHLVNTYEITELRESHILERHNLYYLPFCMIFSSDDRVHRLLAPQLALKNVQF